MKIPKHIRRKRCLEALGNSRLLRRLTHQAYVLDPGAHASRYLFAKRLISRYETFLQLILSRQQLRNKTQTGLQFTFRLPFYIQNIENKSSVQPSIYSSLKNIYKLTKSTIHYIAFRTSKNIFLLNENLISNINKPIKSILIKNILSNSNRSHIVNNTKKSLHYQPLQYHFAYSEILTNPHILIPSHSLETSKFTFPRELQYISKNLKVANINSAFFNRQNYRLDTQKMFKHVLSYQYNQSNTNYYRNIQSQIQKKYLEANLVKIFNYQINHNYTRSKYTNLSSIINQYRFGDNTTPSYRQRYRSIQNAQYRSPISSYNLSQILAAQQILRPQIHQRVHAQTEISNLLGRASHIVHASTLHPAFSTPQPSDQATRERHTVQYTEPEITHKRQVGMQLKSREDQRDAPNEPAVSSNRTIRPLGIAEPPQTHRPFNIDDLANQVMQKMADKLKTEQERRGIFV